MAKTLTAVRFKDRDLEALARLAKQEDETVSSLIRRAVEQFVQRMEKKRKAA